MQTIKIYNKRMKIGRNDPCPCGSGKKYKKCHIGEDISTIMAKKMFQRESYEQNDKLIGRPVISTEFNGHKVVAVGSKLYPSLPINITFH